MTLPNPLLLATALAIGSIIGSFLNVVIFRGPSSWNLVDVAPPPTRETRGNIASPRSYCPKCGQSLGVLHLIPIISFIIQKGQCSACGQRISMRYPIVEAAGALAAVLAVSATTNLVDSALIAFFLWILIALAAIDLETQYLPDALTLPLLASGLVVNAFGRFASFSDAVIGAAVGYGALTAIAVGFRLLRGRDGLGGGDIKLIAGYGAWLGWQALPSVIFLASVGMLIAILVLNLFGSRIDRNTEAPFGPALAAAGAFYMVLIAGPETVFL